VGSLEGERPAVLAVYGFSAMRKPAPDAPFAVTLWLLFCAFCNCAGWLLSAFGELSARGYLVLFGVTAVCAAAVPYTRSLAVQRLRRGLGRGRPLRRRFSRIFPFAFLLVSSLAILGGILHAPTNSDALTQRIPRVLNWLSEGHWHWIANTPSSFNTRASGFEWLMAPMLAVLKTDRLVFLFNVYSFLLLPGLIFSVFTRLGVSKRVAWSWMWLLPTGYCFILQAGSIGNDAIGAVFALAAVDFALRAKASGRCSDLWLSGLAAALLTASKTSNLTLLLPWLLAAWPSLSLLRLRPLGTVGIVLLAAGSSFLPTALLNFHHVRDWSGASYELPPQVAQVSPLVAISGNALNLVVQNLVPPVFPAAAWWNDHAYKAIPTGLLSRMERSFEPSGARLHVHELQLESEAALGFGVAILLLASWVGVRLARHRTNSLLADTAGKWGHTILVRLSPWVSLLVYMAKASLSASGRILAPYYCLLIPSLLMGPKQERIVRQSWWQKSGVAVFCLAGALVVLNPGRPLWPAETALAWMHGKLPENTIVARARMLYSSYGVRWDALGPARSLIPPQEKSIGFLSLLTSTTLETSLWRPFGQHRVRWVRPDDSLEAIRRQEIRFVVIGADSLETPVRNKPFRDWLNEWAVSRRGAIIGSFLAPNVATKPPCPWYVVEMCSEREQRH
jgi:hypothetical protein